MNSGILKIFGILSKVVLSDRSVYKVFGTSAKFSPRQQQVQNFPQLVIKFILKNIRTASNTASTMVLRYHGCGFESQLAGH